MTMTRTTKIEAEKEAWRSAKELFFEIMEENEKYNNIFKMNGFINRLSDKDNEPYIITIKIKDDYIFKYEAVKTEKNQWQLNRYN
jgi:uncharacterized protein (UPF0303 family)